jgi:hypothetical protein
MLTCKDPRCGYVYHSNPPVASKIPAADNRERTTDYAVNVLFGLGFLASRDGPTEGARVLGMLGLPNDTKWKLDPGLILKTESVASSMKSPTIYWTATWASVTSMTVTYYCSMRVSLAAMRSIV